METRNIKVKLDKFEKKLACAIYTAKIYCNHRFIPEILGVTKLEKNKYEVIFDDPSLTCKIIVEENFVMIYYGDHEEDFLTLEDWVQSLNFKF